MQYERLLLYIIDICTFAARFVRRATNFSAVSKVINTSTFTTRFARRSPASVRTVDSDASFFEDGCKPAAAFVQVGYRSYLDNNFSQRRRFRRNKAGKVTARYPRLRVGKEGEGKVKEEKVRGSVSSARGENA